MMTSSTPCSNMIAVGANVSTDIGWQCNSVNDKVKLNGCTALYRAFVTLAMDPHKVLCYDNGSSGKICEPVLAATITTHRVCTAEADAATRKDFSVWRLQVAEEALSQQSLQNIPSSIFQKTKSARRKQEELQKTTVTARRRKKKEE